jgi:proteasome accessory factor B
MPSRTGHRRDRQIVRVLGILRILLDGGRPSVRDLARRFGVRRETIYRDLRTLEQLGYPLVGDEDGRIDGHPQLDRTIRQAPPPILLTPREATGLAWAVRRAGPRSPFSSDAYVALRKLESLMPKGAGEVSRGLWVALHASEAEPAVRPPANVVLTLIEAILGCRRCRLEYPTLERARPRSVLFDPYRLRVVQGVLYCLGRVPESEEAVSTPVVPLIQQLPETAAGHPLAVLAVHRIRDVEPTAEQFTRDPSLDLDHYEGESFGVMWDTPRTVVIRFGPGQAPYVRERVWHPSQTLRELEDGGLELTFRAGGQPEIVRWILGWGDGAEVVAPADLRVAVAQVLQGAAARYATAEPR